MSLFDWYCLIFLLRLWIVGLIYQVSFYACIMDQSASELDVTLPSIFAQMNLSDLSFEQNNSSIDVAEVDDIPSGTTTSPLCLSINVNSLLAKIDELRSFAATYNPALILIQETKLSGNIKSAELDIPSYVLFRKDRNRNGGGVAIYALSSLNPHYCSRGLPRSTHGSKWELVSVTAYFGKIPITVISAYFSPSNSVEIWNSFMTDLSDFIATKDFKFLVLAGDFNHCASVPAEYHRLSELSANFEL